MVIPAEWNAFIAQYKLQYEVEIIADFVRIYQDVEAIKERYTTYEFDTYLPHYIPIADDSGGQFAVISNQGEDSGVYLTSSGALLADELILLAESLQDWMQQGFSFDPIGSSTVTEDTLMALYILDMGPNKLKMVSLLKLKFDVSGSEALALCSIVLILLNIRCIITIIVRNVLKINLMIPLSIICFLNHGLSSQSVALKYGEAIFLEKRLFFFHGFST